MARAVDLVKNKYKDQPVKFFYLLFRYGFTSDPPTPDDAQAFIKSLAENQKVELNDDTRILLDGKAEGIKALWNPTNGPKQTMVLSRGFKVSARGFDAQTELDAAIQDALKK